MANHPGTILTTSIEIHVLWASAHGTEFYWCTLGCLRGGVASLASRVCTGEHCRSLKLPSPVHQCDCWFNRDILYYVLQLLLKKHFDFFLCVRFCPEDFCSRRSGSVQPRIPGLHPDLSPILTNKFSLSLSPSLAYPLSNYSNLITMTQ